MVGEKLLPAVITNNPRLALYENRTLEVVLSGLGSEAMKRYICLVIRGCPKKDAMRLVERNPEVLREWRGEVDEFADIEEFCLVNAHRLENEATVFLFGALPHKIQFLYEKFINKLDSEWDKMDNLERRCLLEAIRVLQPKLMGGNIKEESAYSYDTLVQEVRKKTIHVKK